MEYYESIALNAQYIIPRQLPMYDLQVMKTRILLLTSHQNEICTLLVFFPACLPVSPASEAQQ